MYELSFTFFIVDLQMQYISKTDSCDHNITLPCSCFMQTVDEFIARKPTIVLYFVVLRPLRIDQVSQASLKVLMMCETLARAVLQDLYPRDYMLVLLGDQHDIPWVPTCDGIFTKCISRPRSFARQTFTLVSFAIFPAPLSKVLWACRGRCGCL